MIYIILMLGKIFTTIVMVCVITSEHNEFNTCDKFIISSVWIRWRFNDWIFDYNGPDIPWSIQHIVCKHFEFAVKYM